MSTIMQSSIEKELEDIQASVHGLAEHVDLVKQGRRFMMKEELVRIKKNGPAKHPYCVYLFNDMVLFTEKCSKRSSNYKYISHMYVKDIFFIECDDSKEKYAFGIMHKDEKKKKMKFAAKNNFQRAAWKQNLEKQIEKYCPTDTTFGSGESMVTFGSPRHSWSADELFGFSASLGSTSELESGDDRSTNQDSPPNDPTSVLSKDDSWSNDSGTEGSCYDETEENRSETSEDSDDGDCRVGKIVTQSDGTAIFTHASLNTILWWLINYGDYNEPILIKAFLYSSTTFTNAETLFDNLMQIYNLHSPVPKEISLRYSLCDTRKKVTQFMKIWVMFFFERDFSSNKTLFGLLLDFFADLQKHEQLHDANALKLIIIRVNKKKLMTKKGMNRFQHMNPSQQPGAPSSSSSTTPLRSSGRNLTQHAMSSPLLETNSKFADWNVTAVAEQFVLIEFGLFRAVDLKEISNIAWKSEHPRKTAPNVINIFNRFDLVSQWVATEVVMSLNIKQRVAIIEKLIHLAQKCHDLRNFNSLMEIVAGLNRGSVQRLRKAWEGVAQSSRDTFRALNTVVDSLQNYKNYREQLKKCCLPCLPYFGIFLRDLIFLDAGNPTKIGENINFEKIYMTSRILRDIQTFQRTAYAFEEDEHLMPQLRRLLAMPEEMLYKHSQTIEPTAALASSKEIHNSQ